MITKLIGTKLQILGFEYEVKELPEEHRNNTYGMCHYKPQRLEYDPDLQGLIAEDTVMHEIVHAIDDVLHLNLSESTVHRLGYSLAKVLRDNPHLREFLENSTSKPAAAKVPAKPRPRNKKKAAGNAR